ncbi:YopT-type cysteine protease domain-containing protein, partial [Spartinivicinus poritis]
MSTKLSANDNHSTSNSLNAENFDIPESVNITKSKQLDKNKLERKEKNKNLHLKSILSLVSQGAARAISDEKNDDERSLNARRKTPYFTSSNPSKQKKWRSNGAKELNKPLTNQSVKIKADSTIPKKDIDFVVAVLNELYDIEKNNNQLPKIISALKGITIRLGPMIEKSYEGAAAVYNDKTNTITLDLNKISQLGLTVRQVLVHEALHARDDLQAEQTGRSSIGDTETKTHQIEMMYGAQLIKKGFIKTPFVKKLSIDPIAGDHVHPFNEAELLNNVLNDILERQSQPDGVKTVWYSLDQQDKQAYIQEASKRLLEMQQSTLNILAAQHYQMEGNADSIPQRLENLKALKNQLLRLIDQQGMTPARKKYLDQLNNSIDVYTAQDGRQRRYESIWERRADILKKGDDSKRNQDDSTKLKYNSTKKISDLKNLISTASDPAKKAAYLDLLSNYEKFLSGKVADPRKTLALPLSSDDLPLNASLLMMEEQPGYIRMYISLVDANYDGKQKELHLDSNGDVIIKQKSKDGFINFSFGTPARSLAWQQKYRLDPNPKGTPTYTPIRSVLVKTDFVREYFGNYMESEHSQRDALKAKMLPDGSEITLTSVDRKIENQIGIKFKNNQSFQSILNENIWKGSFQTIALAGYEQALYDPARDGEFVDIKALERKIGFGDRKYLLDFEKTNSDGSKKYLPATPFTKIDQDSNGKFTGGHLSSSETASLYNSSLDFFTKLEQLRDGTAQKQPWYQNDQTRSEFESKLIRILEINHITPGSLVSPTTPDPRYRNGEGNSFNKSRWEAQFANQYLSHQVSQSQIFDLAGKFSQKLDTKTLNNLSEQAYIRSDLAAVRKLVPELTDSDADLLKKLLTGQLTEALLNNQELKALRIQLFFHSLRPAAGEIDSKFRNDPTISHDIGSSNAHIVEINNRKNKIDPYRILNANPSDVEYYDGSYVIKDDKLQSHNQFEPDTQQSTTEYMQNLDAPFTGGISGTTRDISRVYQSLFGNITLQQYWQFQLANAAFMIRNGYHSFFETLYVAARYAPDGDNGIGKEIITIFDRLNQQGELGEKPQGAIYQEVMNKILPIVNDGIDTNSRLTMPPYPGENSRERLVSWNQFRDEGVVKLMATNGVNDKVRLAPQSLYVGLSQSSLPKGRCSGLTEAYLQMLSQGNGVESKNKLFDTLFTHSAIYQRVKDGTVSQQEINEAAKFTNLIDDLHRSNQLAPADNSLKLIGELGIKHIVKKLSDSGDQYLMLNTGNHSLAVAKKGEKYYLYDPNFGDVEVKSSSDLTRVLKKHFNLSFTSQGNKNLAELYQTQLSADKKPVFTVYALDTQNSKVVEKTTILSQFINSDRLMTERDRLMQLGEAEIDGTKIHWTTLYDMGASLNGKRLMAADVQKLQQTGRFDQLQFDRALLGEFVTQRVQTLDHSLSSTAQWLKKVVNQREDSKSLLTNLTEGQNTTIADDFLTSVKQYINNQLNVDPEFWQSLTNKVKTNSHLATANSVSSKVGKGLQGYGYYQNIMGIFNALRRSNQPGVDQSEINKEVGLAAGGLATDLLEPLAEKGLQKAGLSLVNRFGQSASTAGKFASKLGTGLMRAGGAVLGVLTSGFDIYSAVDSFKKLASETDPKKRQDLIVNGSLSVSGAVVGIATAVAIGIGGTAAAVAGPIGVAVAAVLAIGGQIYNAVRQVEELEKWTKLSSREKFDAGFAAFFGIPQRESIMKRVVEGQARDNIDGELAKQGAAQIYNSDLDTIAYSKGKVKVDVERKYYIQVGYWVDDWASDLGGSFKYNNVQHNLTKQEAEQYLKANASRLKESYGQSSDFVSVSMLESVSDRKYNPSLHETDDDIDLSDEIKGSAETKMFQIDTDGQNSKMVKEVTSYEETYRVKTGTKLVGNKAPRVVDVYETRTRTVTPKHNLKATVYNNAGENAAVIQSVENDDKKSAFINLGAGKDKAKGFINKNNIFVVGEGEKTFTGGKKDDAFIISGSRAPNKVSQLTAGEGNDTVIAQGDLTDRTEDT